MVVSEDLYALLDVSQDADANGLRWAYERKLAEASRLGALRRAQEIDQAYAVLREPGRRALYDRHGVTTSVGREHPLQRWSPPKAVPFRAWSPAEEPGRSSVVSCDRRPRRRLAVLLLILSGVSWGAWGWNRAQDARNAPSAETVRVVCPATPAGPGYAYDVTAGQAVTCANGATAQLGTD